jgi:hypothetical protein
MARKGLTRMVSPSNSRSSLVPGSIPVGGGWPLGIDHDLAPVQKVAVATKDPFVLHCKSHRLPKPEQTGSPHLSARQYARILKRWIQLIGADPQESGMHALRRTKATLIDR